MNILLQNIICAYICIEKYICIFIYSYGDITVYKLKYICNCLTKIYAESNLPKDFLI